MHIGSISSVCCWAALVSGDALTSYRLARWDHVPPYTFLQNVLCLVNYNALCNIWKPMEFAQQTRGIHPMLFQCWAIVKEFSLVLRFHVHVRVLSVSIVILHWICNYATDMQSCRLQLHQQRRNVEIMLGWCWASIVGDVCWDTTWFTINHLFKSFICKLLFLLSLLLLHYCIAIETSLSDFQDGNVRQIYPVKNLLQ